MRPVYGRGIDPSPLGVTVSDSDIGEGRRTTGRDRVRVSSWVVLSGSPTVHPVPSTGVTLSDRSHPRPQWRREPRRYASCDNGTPLCENDTSLFSPNNRDTKRVPGRRTRTQVSSGNVPRPFRLLCLLRLYTDVNEETRPCEQGFRSVGETSTLTRGKKYLVLRSESFVHPFPYVRVSHGK